MSDPKSNTIHDADASDVQPTAKEVTKPATSTDENGQKVTAGGDSQTDQVWVLNRKKREDMPKLHNKLLHKMCNQVYDPLSSSYCSTI